jgi:hypothetical protein
MSKFKVGDRVRVKSMDGDYGDDLELLPYLKLNVGKVGTIIEIFQFEMGEYETVYQIQPLIETIAIKDRIRCQIIEICEQDLTSLPDGETIAPS